MHRGTRSAASIDDGRRWPWLPGRALVLSLSASLVLARGAFAHVGPPVAPAALSQTWDWQPAVLLGILAAACLYARGLRRLWQSATAGSGIRFWQAQAFFAGLAVVFAALVSPLDALSSSLFSAHMVQHLLLILVAAPLIMLGDPNVAFVWALPLRWRRSLGRLRSSPAVRGPWFVLRRPAVAWAIAAVSLWGWHLPAFYESALRHQSIHSLEHACLFGSAILFWYVLIVRSGRHGFGYGAALAYTLTMAAQGTILGIAMAFSPAPWYATYAGTTAAWGITPMQDQELAGLIMWIPASVVYLAATVAVFVSWLAAEERNARRLDIHLPQAKTN
jgi:putative membrane protein